MFSNYSLVLLLIIAAQFTPIRSLKIQHVFAKNESKPTRIRHYNPLPPFWTPFLGARALKAYDHSIYRGKRIKSDCNPNCPAIDVWGYAFKDPNDQETVLFDSRPFSTRKSFWKTSTEARVISVSLFGNQERYTKGLIDFINSFQVLSEVNRARLNRSGIRSLSWGYETFILRAYVAKRNPSNANDMGQIKNATDDVFLAKLLDLGCELAFVDNHREEVDRDATFWRFLVAAEKMPEHQRLRYLVRDIDWKATSAEAFSVGEWIKKGHQFHRMNLQPICMGPLTAGIWGGVHSGAGILSDLPEKIRYYPYRCEYGDDEIFLRDMVWPVMKNSGSILTHLYKRRFVHWVANPYKNSCEEPTQNYCMKLNKNSHCEDAIVPRKIKFPIFSLGYNAPLSKLKQDASNFVFPEFPDYDNLNHRISESLVSLAG